MSYQLIAAKAIGMKSLSTTTMHHTPAIRIEVRAVDESVNALPRRHRMPHYLPLCAPLPRAGELIYVSSTSAWRVSGVVHQWHAPDDLHVLVWVEFAGSTHHAGRPAFDVTQ